MGDFASMNYGAKRKLQTAAKSDKTIYTFMVVILHLKVCIKIV